MHGDFFGEYLIQCEAITEDKLSEAIAYQKQHNQLMGKLALDKGYLTHDQVRQFLQEQTLMQKKFGQLAQEKGLLSREQIQELLQDQAESHIYLGEALQRLGYLSIDQLNVHLNNFKRELQNDKKVFSQRIEELPQRDLLWKGLEVVEDLFYRLGYVLKIKRVLEDSPVSPHQPVFLMDQVFAGTGRALFGLQMSWSAVGVTARDNARYPNGGYNGPRDLDITAEVMHSLNYVLCEDLRLAGYKVKPGSVRFELPQDYQKALGIRLHSMLGPVTMLYYFL
jgi:hypothetical protein